MHLYFARHGESEANLLREFSNRGQKHGLTPKGREQAAALAHRLLALGIDRVICSPLLRARETAGIVGAALGVNVEESDALREWDVGVLEGRSDEEAWRRYFRVRRDWADGKHESCIEGGESLLDVARRFVPFVEGLAVEARAGSRFALISHGGVYCAALPLVVHNIDAEFAERHGIDNASFVAVEVTATALICTDWAGVEGPPTRAATAR